MFLATFRRGFAQAVAQRLEAAHIDPVRVEDDMVFFEYEKRPYLPWSQGVYHVLGRYETRTVPDLMRQIQTDEGWPAVLREKARGETFHIRCMREGETMLPDAAALRQVENIAYQAGLAVHRLQPRHRLLIWLRNNGEGYFLKALTPQSQEGQDIYHLLCAMGQIQRQDRCADPFCGDGAIVRAMMFYRPMQISAVDADGQAVATLRGVRGVHAEVADSVAVPGPVSSADVMITRPPWERYVQALGEGYRHTVLTLLARQLAPGGRLVLYVPKDFPLEEMAVDCGLDHRESIQDGEYKAVCLYRPVLGDFR